MNQDQGGDLSSLKVEFQQEMRHLKQAAAEEKALLEKDKKELEAPLNPHNPNPNPNPDPNPSINSRLNSPRRSRSLLL